MESVIAQFSILREAFSKGALNARVADLIREIEVDKELGLAFWSAIAKADALEWFVDNKLITMLTLADVFGRAQMNILHGAAPMFPALVDELLSEIVPADEWITYKIFQIINSAPSTIGMPKVSSRLPLLMGKFHHFWGYDVAGELADKLIRDGNDQFHKFNETCIKSFSLKTPNGRDNFEIREYFKASNQPNPSLGDENINIMANCCSVLIEMASAGDHGAKDELGILSTIWLTSLVDDKDNSDWDGKTELCKNIVKFCDSICEHGSDGLKKVVNVLEEYPQVIFRRIGVHVVGLHGSVDEVANVLSDRSKFDDSAMINEVANLYRKRFGQMPDLVKEEFFALIDSGPEDKSFQDFWRLRKLSWVKDYLSGERLIQYRGLLEKFGENALTLADRNHHSSTGWRGSLSPITLDQLRQVSIEEAIEMVGAWRPAANADFDSPTLEGLANSFQKLVSEKPVKWSENAERLFGLRPYFVGRAFSAWTTYAREHGDLDWSSIFDLVHNILSLPVEDELNEDPNNGGPRILDRDWRWTRQSISELISKACDHEVDLKLRPRFLSALVKMLNDDPASAIIETKDFLRRDHAMDALNSGRGKVASALCDLAVWTARKDSLWNPTKEGGFQGGIERLRDVQGLIGQHFDDSSNINAGTWAAYALRANQLQWLDPKWFREGIIGRVILNEGVDGEMAPWAFWLTFLKFQQANQIWLEAFRICYESTAERLESMEYAVQDEIEALGDYLEHLLVYYWWGVLKLEKNGLLDLALTRASPKRRMQAMAFVGGALNRSTEEPPPNIIQLFQEIWDWYWKNFAESDLSSRRDDRHRQSLFGDWLASGFLDKKWSLDRFIAYLDKDNEADHGDDELERLDAWCTNLPIPVLQATRLLVLGDREGWRMHLWKKSIPSILDKTKPMSDEPIRTARDALLEALIRRGHTDLLKGEGLS